MADRRALETVFRKHGFDDFKWINPKDIVVAQWVRMKCVYGCPGYGSAACCPPNTPPVAECRDFFQEYDKGIIFHMANRFADPEDRHAWSREVNFRLSSVEREVFHAGYHKAFLLFMDSCSFCEDCARVRQDCADAKAARPSPEAMAVDVFSTVRQYGLPIEVLRQPTAVMNRYAILLVE